MSKADQIALAGVLVSLATPIVLLVIGYFIDQRIKSVETTLENDRRLSDARFELYRDIAFQLNDIYAYFNFVGLWKTLSCHDIIERKRELDRHVYSYRPIFSEDFFRLYVNFTDAAFVTNVGWRKDAKLRTFTEHRDEEGDPNAMACFTQEDNRHEIRKAYEELLTCLAADLSLASSMELEK